MIWPRIILFMIWFAKLGDNNRGSTKSCNRKYLFETCLTFYCLRTFVPGNVRRLPNCSINFWNFWKKINIPKNNVQIFRIIRHFDPKYIFMTLFTKESLPKAINESKNKNQMFTQLKWFCQFIVGVWKTFYVLVTCS